MRKISFVLASVFLLQSSFAGQNSIPTNVPGRNLQLKTPDPSYNERIANRQRARNAMETLNTVTEGIESTIQTLDKLGMIKLLKKTPLIGDSIDTAQEAAALILKATKIIGNALGNRVIYNNSYHSNHEIFYDQYVSTLSQLDKLSESLLKAATNPSSPIQKNPAKTLEWFDNLLIKHGFSKPDPAKAKVIEDLQKEYKKTLKDFKLAFGNLILIDAEEDASIYRCALDGKDRCFDKMNKYIQKKLQNEEMIYGLSLKQLDLTTRERFAGLIKFTGSKALVEKKKNTILTNLSNQKIQLDASIEALDASIERINADSARSRQELSDLETKIAAAKMIIGTDGVEKSLEARVAKLEKLVTSLDNQLNPPVAGDHRRQSVSHAAPPVAHPAPADDAGGEDAPAPVPAAPLRQQAQKPSSGPLIGKQDSMYAPDERPGAPTAPKKRSLFSFGSKKTASPAA